jgi:hypothetical protein
MFSSAFFRQSGLLLALLLALGTRSGAAQTIRHYATWVVQSVNTLDPHAAMGQDPSTQATLAPPALFGTASVRLGLPTAIATGSKAGLIVDSGGLLALAALNGMAIKTYLAPSTTAQQTISLSQLLTLQVLNAGRATAEFTATKPFDQIELVAGGLLNAYTIGLVAAYADAAAPLPVQLVGFQANATPAGVQLSWQTASERHNAYFAIERAPGEAPTAFTELGRVAGLGSSSQAHRYQYLDAAPGSLTYYRLRQVDADGTATYSPVVAVQASGRRTLGAYPVPVLRGQRLHTPLPATARPVLTDLLGRPVACPTLPALDGTLDMDTQNLRPGAYWLTVAGIAPQRLVVQE